MSIIIFATIRIAPEVRERALVEANPLIKEAQSEPGCLAYQWSLDPNTDDVIYAFEHWESAETLQAHFAAHSYTAMLVHLGQYDVQADALKYEVTQASPVYNASGEASALFE
jgi:quinol monooxygenase YgiN